jgi:hypothetical protein
MVTGFFQPQRAHFFSFLQKESEYRAQNVHSQKMKNVIIKREYNILKLIDTATILEND